MDLAYLSGQRPADVLKLRLADIRDGPIAVDQAPETQSVLGLVIKGFQDAACDEFAPQ